MKYNKNTDYKIITYIFTAEIWNNIKIIDYLITTPENVFLLPIMDLECEINYNYKDVLKQLAIVSTANIMHKLIGTKIFVS